RTKDSALMIPPRDRAQMRSWSRQNLYSYEYIFPSAHAPRAHEYMKADLDRFFGYDVRMEKRKVECFLLKTTGTQHQRLQTKGGVPLFDSNVYFVKMINAPLGQLVHWLEHKYLAS